MDERKKGQWVDVSKVVDDVEHILDKMKSTPGRPPVRIEAFWKVFRIVSEKVTPFVPHNILRIVFLDHTDPDDAVYQARRGLNKALRDEGSDYEVGKTSFYRFRRKKRD